MGESFETVYGSRQSDLILGDDEHNVLFGGFDSYGDTIRGRDGNDYIEGYEGDDLMRGGGGDDVFSGFDISGTDDIQGGAGNDLVRLCGHFSGKSAYCGDGETTSLGVTVDLEAGTISGAGDTTLTNIENVEGTAYEDSIIGSEASNQLYGGPGNDSISGGDGDDLIAGDSFAPLPPPLGARLREGDLLGADGDDDLDGGNGADSLDGNGGDDACVDGEQVANCES